MSSDAVYFELHIQPMFRPLDQEHMLSAAALNLWDYDQVRSKADIILSRLQADMPPIAFGGLWPAEWINLFQRWKNDGFQRLALGKVDPPGYTARRAGTLVTLEGHGSLPDSGYQAWLQLIVEEGQPRHYVHYWKPLASSAASVTRPFRVREIFATPASTVSIAVIDFDGRHDVAIT